MKTDIWDYDMIGQAPGNGINGDYDGSYRSRNMLKYKKTVGDVDLYGSYLFEDSEYLPGNGLRYKRKGGGSVGADYHIMKDLTGYRVELHPRGNARPVKRRQQNL